MKTYMASASTIERKWYVVDAADYTLGRLASQVAAVLRGKNKPTYTPFLDCGDNVIVINADKVKVTGKKLDQKVYYSHSDYVGGLKETTLKEMMEKKPEKVIELAVKGMLPKGPLGRQMFTKLQEALHEGGIAEAIKASLEIMIKDWGVSMMIGSIPWIIVGGDF